MQFYSFSINRKGKFLY